MAQRVFDGSHLGRAGGDKENTDLAGFDTMLLAVLFSGERCGDFHGLLEGHNVLQQPGKAYLDDAGDGRAGRGNERPLAVSLGQHLAQGLCDDISAAGYFKDLIKAKGAKGVQQLAHAVAPAVKLSKK